MFPSSASNNEALRRALHSSLQEVLIDVASDVQPTAALSGYGTQPHGLLDSSLSFPGYSDGLMRSSLPPLPSYLRGSVLGTHPSETMRTGVPLHQPDQNLLNHARAQLLKQQLIADERKRQLLLDEQRKMLLQDSYLALLQADASAKAKSPAASSPPMALDVLLAAQSPSMQHQLSRPVLPIPPVPSYLSQQPTVTSQKHSPNALEALGSSLRNKNDPYIDVSSLQDPDPKDSSVRRTRGGVSTPFPEKLHEMLMDVEKEGKTDIVSFFSHGRAFGVHDPDRFVSEIMPKYFKQSKWNSFARQLNLYGFIRITSGPDAGGYYHELFLKGRPNLCFHMRRVGVPQGGDRRKLKTKQESPDPDFYSMKPLSASALPTPGAHSS